MQLHKIFLLLLAVQLVSVYAHAMEEKPYSGPLGFFVQNGTNEPAKFSTRGDGKRVLGFDTSIMVKPGHIQFVPYTTAKLVKIDPGRFIESYGIYKLINPDRHLLCEWDGERVSKLEITLARLKRLLVYIIANDQKLKKQLVNELQKH